MPIRTCECCNFSSNHKRVFASHMKSKRHLTRVDDMYEENIQHFSCDKCTKSYTSRSGLWRHSHVCKATSVVVPPPNILHTETLAVLEQIKEMLQHQTSPAVAANKVKNDSPEYIYLLQEREFVKSGQPIYKIGKTKQPNQKRFSQYPKGSVLLFQRICHNCHQVEGELIRRFKEVFKQHTDIGSEYFEGDSFAMMEHMNAVVTKG